MSMSLPLVATGLIIGVAAWYLIGDQHTSVHCTASDHQRRLDAVLASLATRPPGSKISLHRRALSSNTIRNASHKSAPTYFPVDLSSFRHIIEIHLPASSSQPVVPDEDEGPAEGGYVVVEPGILFGELLRELLKVGMTTLVVPELPGITVGGAIAGGGLESSSFRYGQVSDTVLEIECLTPDLVVCSPEVNGDLFYAISASYNTVALMTRVKLRIHPAPKYVSLSMDRYDSFESAVEGLQAAREWHDVRIDTIEGLAYSPSEILVIRGQYTARPLYPVRRFNRHWDEWYYKSVRSGTPISVPYADYCFRYNYGSFWMASYVLEMLGGDNLFTRFIIGAFLDTKHLFAVLHSSNLSDLGRMRLIQDCYIPESKAAEFLQEVEKEVGVYPLWLCPIKGTRTPQVLASHHMTKARTGTEAGVGEGVRVGVSGDKTQSEGGDEHFINVGIYGRPRDFPFNPSSIHSRLVELLLRLGGRSMLYAQTWHTREQFGEMYSAGLDRLSAVRRKYADGEECFFDLYDKVALSEAERQALARPAEGTEAEELKKVVKDILLHKVGLR